MENAEVIRSPVTKAEDQVVRTQHYIRVLATIVGSILLIMGGVTSVSTFVLLTHADGDREYLIQCTTPGPKEPTKEDPSTGHECYDGAQQRVGQAVILIGDDVDRRVCHRIQEAFNQTEHRPINLVCKEIPE